MRRLAAVATALVLTTAGIAPADAAAARIGGPCKKLHQVDWIKGVRAQCTWIPASQGKKGHAVWKPLAPAKTTATAAELGVAIEPIDIHKVPVYRFADGRLLRQSNGKYYAADSRAASTVPAIRAAAYAAIAAHPTSDTHPHVQFDYWVSPAFPKDMAELCRTQLELAAARWDSEFTEPITVSVVLATELDLDYVSSRIDLFSDSIANLQRFNTLNQSTNSAWITGGGSYRSHNGTMKGVVFLGTASWARQERLNHEWPQVAAHEFAHVVQQYLMRDRAPRTELQDQLQSPVHLIEGSADTLGFLTAFGNLGWSSDALDHLTWSYFRNASSWRSASTLEDIHALLTATESRTPTQAFDLSYAIGALLYEWVIATYGLDAFLKLLREVPKHADFNDSVQTALGTSKMELYAKAAPYILDSVQRTA